MGILEKISEIEKEIARTQKNKGTFWMIFVSIEMGKWACTDFILRL